MAGSNANSYKSLHSYLHNGYVYFILISEFVPEIFKLFLALRARIVTERSQWSRHEFCCLPFFMFCISHNRH